jgi:hypothetical protein
VPPYATYATVAKATVQGPCIQSCFDPEDASTACRVFDLVPTASGTCRVEVTSSTNATFTLTYSWAAVPVDGCPGCTELDLADGGSSPHPFVKDCGGEAGGSDGG